MKAKLLLLSSLLLVGCSTEITVERQNRDVANLPKAFSILEQKLLLPSYLTTRLVFSFRLQLDENPRQSKY